MLVPDCQREKRRNDCPADTYPHRNHDSSNDNIRLKDEPHNMKNCDNDEYDHRNGGRCFHLPLLSLQGRLVTGPPFGKMIRNSTVEVKISCDGDDARLAEKKGRRIVGLLMIVSW